WGPLRSRGSELLELSLAFGGDRLIAATPYAALTGPFLGPPRWASAGLRSCGQAIESQTKIPAPTFDGRLRIGCQQPVCRSRIRINSLPMRFRDLKLGRKMKIEREDRPS